VSGVSVALVVRWTMGAAVLFATPAFAQNLDAGKSPAQIFSDTCSACHRSAREVRQSSPGFLREHYTTGAREAASMAAYLASVGSDSRAIQQRKPPSLGTGGAQQTDRDRDQSKPTDNQAALPNGRRGPAGEGTKPPGEASKPTGEPSKPAGEAAAKPGPAATTAAVARSRRPSDSVEAGQPFVPTAAETDAPPQTAATPAARPAPAEDFEE
jgi:hypothetical protein